MYIDASMVISAVICAIATCMLFFLPCPALRFAFVCPALCFCYQLYALPSPALRFAFVARS
jgi:hypothetical protein